MTTQQQPTVLIVEDEPDVAETYRIWLDAEYDIRVATDGGEAMEALDEDVDVVLLDRMLPGQSGAAVLSEIRERGVDCRVAMVTAVDPDFDIVEMGFDEYVTKPPSREGLMETVETLLERAHVDDELQSYYSLVAKRAALEAEKTATQLAESESYAELVERLEKQRAAVDESLGDLSEDTSFVGAIRELDDGGSTEVTKDE